MPNTEITTVSKKIESKEERERLLNIVKKYLPENCGAIVRTSAEHQGEEKIKNDIEVTINKWNEIYDTYEKVIEESNYPKNSLE